MIVKYTHLIELTLTPLAFIVYLYSLFSINSQLLTVYRTRGGMMRGKKALTSNKGLHNSLILGRMYIFSAISH